MKMMMMVMLMVAVRVVAESSEIDTECEFRKLTYEAAKRLRPDRGESLDVFDALELFNMCGVERPTSNTTFASPRFEFEPSVSVVVDPTNGNDLTGIGSVESPVKSIYRGIRTLRRSRGDKSVLALRKGVHFINETIMLTSSDSNIRIESYNGEEVWISGGIKIQTSWQRFVNPNVKPKPKNCSDACVLAGHCCEGSQVSSFQHPSCVMGCAFGQSNLGSSNLSSCEEMCHEVDNLCDWTFSRANLSGNNCGDCVPRGCDASDGVQECLEGCRYAFGIYNNLNMWYADISEVDQVGSLNTLEPLTRMTRARWPNVDSVDFRPFKNVLPSKWIPPAVKPQAQQIWINATTRDGFDSSTMPTYNGYGNGVCSKVHDSNCPCGIWSDVRDGEWSSYSYWCSGNAAGGWAEMDTGNSFYNGPVIPTGLVYNATSTQSRFQTYDNATGAVIVGWRAQGWFNNMFEVSEHDKTSNMFTFKSGGQQGGRGWQTNGTTGAIEPTPPFFIENVFEELDYPNEFFFNVTEKRLYVVWNSSSTAPPENLKFVVPQLRRLISAVGDNSTFPIRNVTIRGLRFRDASTTYMAEWGVPSGGDWALHRGGAVFLENTKNITIENNLFRRVDGNAIFVSGYNRDVSIYMNEFNFIGDTAVGLWGYTDEFDGRNGEQPRGTQIVGNVCHEIGSYQLQSACVFQAKSARTTISRNVFFNGPRSGINFNDGFGGGNRVENNVIFNQCRQSGDHGPINSWDRQLYFTDLRSPSGSWSPIMSNVSRNVIIANYGGSQGFDNDDGSSWYNISRNVIFGEGFKMDYGGHDSVYVNNLNIVKKYDGQNCLNTGNFKRGNPPCANDALRNGTCSHSSRFENNHCIVLYTDVYAQNMGACPPDLDSMPILRNNSYYTPNQGNATSEQCKMTVYELQKHGIEIGSTSKTIPSDSEWKQWAIDLLGWL